MIKIRKALNVLYNILIIYSLSFIMYIISEFIWLEYIANDFWIESLDTLQMMWIAPIIIALMGYAIYQLFRGKTLTIKQWNKLLEIKEDKREEIGLIVKPIREDNYDNTHIGKISNKPPIDIKKTFDEIHNLIDKPKVEKYKIGDEVYADYAGITRGAPIKEIVLKGTIIKYRVKGCGNKLYEAKNLKRVT